MTSQRHLKDIFGGRIAEGGPVRGRDGVSIAAVRDDLDNVVRLISERCRSGTYRFTTYRQRLASKGANKAPREISIPSVRDRIALRALAEMLASIFPDRAGKLPQTAVSQVTEAVNDGSYDAFVRIDVQNFYPSIDHDLLIRQLSNTIRKRAILQLIRRAVATPTAADRSPAPKALTTVGVPQGLSISNVLAEVYMTPVDRAMTAVSSCSYHRFVDDILILCSKSDAESIDAKCRDELARLKLKAHPRHAGPGKSDIGDISDGVSYLGYVISASGISVRDSSVLALESRLAKIYAEWRRAKSSGGRAAATADQRFHWHRNVVITGCVFQRSANGWLQYFRQLDDLTVLSRLDATVSRLSRRYGVPAAPPPKSFRRAYWAVKHPRSRSRSYVPDYDSFGPNEMARELVDMGVDLAGMSERQIRDAFFGVVSRVVRELERDIGDLS